MTEPTLAFIAAQLERVLDEQRTIRVRLDGLDAKIDAMHGAFAELRDEHNVATSLALRASQGRVTVEALAAEIATPQDPHGQA